MSKIEVNQVSSQCGSTLTIGQSGDTVQLASGASQTGFGRTGTVDWQTTPKTANFTAANGEGYFINTTSGAVTMTMPSGSAGAIVSIQDYNKTFDTNNFTVTPASGEKINGGSASNSLTISTEGQGLTFVYVDSTVGWKTVHENEFIKGGGSFITATGGTVTTCGDFKIHTFTGPGTFCVSAISVCAPKNVVDYVAVAGGGGGGSGFSSGGGGAGAGGFRYYANTTCNPQTCAPAAPLNNFPSGTAITVTATGFPITVGGGGAGAPQSYPTKSVGTSGANSIFSTVTAAGGGGGGSEGGCCASVHTGANGGSGGGGGYHAGSGGAGSGNTPPVTPAQGTDGGNFGGPSNPARMGGGGGGAKCAGTPGLTPIPASTRGDGGDGAGVKGFGTSGENCGSYYYFSGGGGAQSQFNPRGNPGTCASRAQGGLGGGGKGSDNCSPSPTYKQATAGTNNTGGGGGGMTPGTTVVNGGSGIVIIRYKFQ